ncbi:multiple sugar transport system permease protein [Halopelagius inordinatus]|uniref:Multiple sugar transport system permease protein n=1 Tax=Halopelagius inordinatus TaxID=553467 RepID=A0A1I2RHZ5_9EURY|nr:carbohydrate ABC transporter permease [Halopelagius inordinatus]SFG40285.1 multiple sugar transport system permease protein [Halopelagius inordinatus]
MPGKKQTDGGTNVGTAQDADISRGPLERWVGKVIKNPKRAYRAMFYVATFFFLVTTLFPFYWLLVLALTPNNLISNMGLVPKGFNPEVFVLMFERVPFHLFMFNSFVLGIATTVIVLLLASLAGYVFGRLRFPGKSVLMLAILAISYFPPAAFFLPLFELFTGNLAVSLGPLTISSPDLFNTPAPMVLPFSALFMPLSIFILTTFYGQIPDGLEDAARVEGTTRLGALFRVIIPLSAPGVATAGVLTFISVYNEFFFSFLMNNGEANSWAPIVAGILKYQGQFDTPYNLMAAASIVGVLPVAILVIIAQEKIVSGLTAGALKE